MKYRYAAHATPYLDALQAAQIQNFTREKSNADDVLLHFFNFVLDLLRQCLKIFKFLRFLKSV
jgi:hypothetical protein